ncbi:rubrerythrin-like domain-containing protein [Salarchaeum sp. III]
MRPSDSAGGSGVFECFSCGARVSAPSGRTCSECGGELNNIGAPRDF